MWHLKPGLKEKKAGQELRSISRLSNTWSLPHGEAGFGWLWEGHSAAVSIDKGRVHFYLQPSFFPPGWTSVRTGCFFFIHAIFIDFCIASPVRFARAMICFAIHQWKLRSLARAGNHITNTKTN